MTLRASTPVPSLPSPRAELAASPPNGWVEVAAPSPAAAEDSGTWVPATGGSFTLCFLGQPASSAAPANSNAIDIILFIESLHQVLSASRAVRVPTMSWFVKCLLLGQNGAHVGSCNSPSLETTRC